MQQAIISRSPIGTFAFSPGGELIFYRLYSREPSKALEEFNSKTKMKELKDYEVSEDNAFIRRNFRQYALNLGFCDNEADLNRFISEFGALLSRERLAGMIGRDRLLIQASNALEDSNRIVSLMMERLYEWYTLHYPECRLDKKQLIEVFERTPEKIASRPDVLRFK